MTADIVTISHNNELNFYHYNIKYSSNNLFKKRHNIDI